jgi:hypothetical protein
VASELSEEVIRLASARNIFVADEEATILERMARSRRFQVHLIKVSATERDQIRVTTRRA